MPGRVGADDPVAVHGEADERPLAVARRVSDDLDHGFTVALAGPRQRARGATLARLDLVRGSAFRLDLMKYKGACVRRRRRQGTHLAWPGS